MAKKKGQQLNSIADTLIPPDPTDPAATTLELDEMWSFVATKVQQHGIWLAICRKTRQVVAYAIGARNTATCRNLWRAIPNVYRTGTCSTDFWQAYAAVTPDEQHEPVGKETGETAHIERFNNTIRQRLAGLSARPYHSQNRRICTLSAYISSYGATIWKYGANGWIP